MPTPKFAGKLVDMSITAAPNVRRALIQTMERDISLGFTLKRPWHRRPKTKPVAMATES